VFLVHYAPTTPLTLDLLSYDTNDPVLYRVLKDLENLENSGNLSTLETSGKIQGILG